MYPNGQHVYHWGPPQEAFTFRFAEDLADYTYNKLHVLERKPDSIVRVQKVVPLDLELL